MCTNLEQITKTKNGKNYIKRDGLWVETTESFLARGGFIQVYDYHGNHLYDTYFEEELPKKISLLKAA